jgi:hypothetical protein
MFAGPAGGLILQEYQTLGPSGGDGSGGAGDEGPGPGGAEGRDGGRGRTNSGGGGAAAFLGLCAPHLLVLRSGGGSGAGAAVSREPLLGFAGIEVRRRRGRPARPSAMKAHPCAPRGAPAPTTQTPRPKRPPRRIAGGAPVRAGRRPRHALGAGRVFLPTGARPPRRRLPGRRRRRSRRRRGRRAGRVARHGAARGQGPPAGRRGRAAPGGLGARGAASARGRGRSEALERGPRGRRRRRPRMRRPDPLHQTRLPTRLRLLPRPRPARPRGPAEHCLANMDDARGARALRAASSLPEPAARVAAAAVHLGLADEARRLLAGCGRWDLLAGLRAAGGEWGEAIAAAEANDRRARSQGGGGVGAGGRGRGAEGPGGTSAAAAGTPDGAEPPCAELPRRADAPRHAVSAQGAARGGAHRVRPPAGALRRPRGRGPPLRGRRRRGGRGAAHAAGARAAGRAREARGASRRQTARPRPAGRAAPRLGGGDGRADGGAGLSTAPPARGGFLSHPDPALATAGRSAPLTHDADSPSPRPSPFRNRRAGSYVASRSDPQLLTWWARYCESRGAWGDALAAYQRTGERWRDGVDGGGPPRGGGGGGGGGGGRPPPPPPPQARCSPSCRGFRLLGCGLCRAAGCPGQRALRRTPSAVRASRPRLPSAAGRVAPS